MPARAVTIADALSSKVRFSRAVSTFVITASSSSQIAVIVMSPSIVILKPTSLSTPFTSHALKVKFGFRGAKVSLAVEHIRHHKKRRFLY